MILQIFAAAVPAVSAIKEPEGGGFVLDKDFINVFEGVLVQWVRNLKFFEQRFE